MNRLVPSIIIAHGMLDYLTWSSIGDVFNYNLLIIVNYYLFQISADFCFMLFLLGSMYHFGEDFRYLTDGSSFDRVSGMLFLTTLIKNSKSLQPVCLMLNLNYTLFKEFNHTLFLNACVFTSAVNTKLKIASILLLLFVNFFDPDTEFIVYLAFGHVPLAIYRYWRTYGKDVVYTWFLFILLIYSVSIGTINKRIVEWSISIVNVHMIYVTYWQNIKIIYN